MPPPPKKPSLTHRPAPSPTPSSSSDALPKSQKPQILTAKQARLRARQDAITNNISDLSSDPSHEHTSTSRSSRSFFSRLRDRYATIPNPVKRTFRVLRVLAPVIPIGIFFSEHVLQVMWVRGPSMTPYLNENYAETQTESDMVLVNMWPWGTWPWQQRRRLERGMVVTFRSPANPSHIAIKRVIALPGDRVSTREPCPRPSQIVPFNHVWLEGDADDPRKSLDSNTYGPVSISLITGRVLGVVWPRMRVLKWWEWDQPQEHQIQQGDNGAPDSGTVIRRDTTSDYRRPVKDRVVKEAVKVESPYLE